MTTGPHQFALDGDNFALQSKTMTALARMHALLPLTRRSLTLWFSAFFSPTLYFLLLILADRFFIPSPPEILVASLFYLIPPVALLVCGSVLWFSSLTVARKIGWMLFTLFAMLLQFGILLAIMIVATGFAPT
jgi:hypothetical protein